ncbi:MAG: APC family permease [Anaeroplasmataceae bacterium]
METQVTKKYGIFTGISLVIGIIIGSGVFIKAGAVLQNTNGSLALSLVAWLVGGLIMISSAYAFSLVLTRSTERNGLLQIIEDSTNKKFSYYIGWYFATIYYPILTSILSFVSAGYILNLFGVDSDIFRWILTVILILFSAALNFFAPKIAGYFQVSTTIVKLIPIFVIAVVGSFYGLFQGNFGEIFITNTEVATNNFGKALTATIFAFEGWICALSISKEIKNPQKNLAKSLMIGTSIVLLCYLIYYFGLSMIIPNTSDIINAGNNAPIIAMQKLLGNFGGVLFNIFLIISCLGTLNGVTIGGSRAMSSIAENDMGIAPKRMKKIHPKFNMSVLSSAIALIIALFFVIIWYLSLSGYLPFATMDELCIVVVYIAYIFVYIDLIKNFKHISKTKRIISGSLAIISSVVLVLFASGIINLFIFKENKFDTLKNFSSFMLVIAVNFVVAFLIQRQTFKKQIKESIIE